MKKGIRSVFIDDPQIKALLEKKEMLSKAGDPSSLFLMLQSAFQGNKGDTPEKGVDYFTDEEISEFKKAATPVKFTDYFTEQEIGAMMTQMYEAVLGALRDGLKEELTPKKGIDYSDGESADEDRIIEVLSAKIPTLDEILAKIEVQRGDDGNDAELTGSAIIEAISALEGKDKDALGKKLGAMIDISQVRNAQSFMYKGTKYKTEELMHGGGSSSGSGSSVATQTVTAVQVGDDATVNLTQLAHTFTGIVFISSAGRVYTPGSTDPGEGYVLVGSTATLYGTSASAQIVVSYTY